MLCDKAHNIHLALSPHMGVVTVCVITRGLSTIKVLMDSLCYNKFSCSMVFICSFYYYLLIVNLLLC